MIVSWTLFPHLIVHEGPIPPQYWYSCPHSSQLAKGSIGGTFLLTSHWPDLVIWQHSLVRKAGKHSLYFGQHVPRVLFFKKKKEDSAERELMVCHNPLSYENRSLFYFPAAIGSWHISSAISLSIFFFFFLLYFSQQKRILMHSERCEVSWDLVDYCGLFRGNVTI